MYRKSGFHAFAAFIAVAAALIALVAAQPAPQLPSINWRTSVAGVNSNGYIDSSTASIASTASAGGTIDTSVWFNARNVHGLSSSPTSTAYGSSKIFIWTTGAPASTDTVFLTIQRSMNGSTVGSAMTQINVVLGTANDKAVGYPIVIDSDALPAAAGDLWLWPYWRFIVKGDNNTGAIFPTARLSLGTYEWNK